MVTSIFRLNSYIGSVCFHICMFVLFFNDWSVRKVPLNDCTWCLVEAVACRISCRFDCIEVFTSRCLSWCCWMVRHTGRWLVHWSVSFDLKFLDSLLASSHHLWPVWHCRNQSCWSSASLTSILRLYTPSCSELDVTSPLLLHPSNKKKKGTELLGIVYYCGASLLMPIWLQWCIVWIIECVEEVTVGEKVLFATLFLVGILCHAGASWLS